MKRLVANVDTTDGVLAALGLMGVLLFFWLLPYHHPDAAADFSLERETAVQRAREFLREGSVNVRQRETRVRPRRQEDLIEQIQRRRGRPTTVRFLRSVEGQRLPAYYWSVQFTRSAQVDSPSVNVSVGSAAEDDFIKGSYIVYLTKAGQPWSVELPDDHDLIVDQNAFQEAFAATPDSFPGAQLRFVRADSAWGRSLGSGELLGDTSGRVELPLGPHHAAQLARYHLGRTAWPTQRFRVDSTWQPTRRTATVRFASTQPISGQTVQADLTVAAGGALREMDVTFNPNRSEAGLNGEQIAGGARSLTLLLLLGVLVVVFFRRLMNRLIDVRAALVDAGVAGILFLIFFGVQVLVEMKVEAQAGSFGLEWFAVAAAGGIAALVIGLPFFMVSAAADSLMRESWPEKGRTSGLLRRGAWHNVPVGSALVRGIALAGVLLGIAMGGLILFSQAVISLDSQLFWYLEAIPVVGRTVNISLLAYFGVLAVLAGAGTLLYRWTGGRAVLVVLGIILVGVPLFDQFVELRPIGYQWASTAAVALAVGAAFWRYDLLTCFTGIFLAMLAWTLSPSWLIGGAATAQVGTFVAGGVVFVVAALGAWGLASGRQAKDVDEYVPAYVKKLAEEERIGRELEIAREVHTSFLPRRMPRVAGLDLAALCLAANEVGGDYYDFVETQPGQLVIMMGDVSGKGIQAAFYMTLAKGILQTLSREERSPAEVLRRLNVLFRKNAPRGTFISLICGFLDVEAGTLTVARAGHNPIVHVHRDETELIRPRGLAIGLADDAAFAVEEVTLSLEPGDVLAFYTDGITEAMNPAHEQYGVERLVRRLQRVWERPAQTILQAVADDVARFIEPAGRRDDMTMVVVRYEGASASARRDGSRRAIEQQSTHP